MAENTDFHTALIHGLLHPDAWPASVHSIEHIETHISTVLLAGNYAYKIKKPVDLGFLDFSTLERRKHFCEEEIRLNRRLAPAIYLGVVPITGSLQSPMLDGEGEAIEYAVKMRRFDSDALLSRHPDLLTPDRVDEMAQIVADFHKSIAVTDLAEPFGTGPAILTPMLENFTQIREWLDRADELLKLDQLEQWTKARYNALQDILSVRRNDGYIRECHGDMHLGNIALVDDEILIFDGIEFAPGLRWIDVISEVAFLIMDLDEKGRPDLAQRFLNRYLAITGDYGGLDLLRFYQVYRAMVRAKVDVIRLQQSDLPLSERESVLADCRAYLDQAEGYTQVQPPALVITHGVSGSGKSTTVLSLLGPLSAVQIRSDVERKRLADIALSAGTGSAVNEGIYHPQVTEKTYQRLHMLAEVIISAGYTAIVDATFLKRSQRRSFYELAQQLGVSFLIFDFQAPLETLRERIAKRLTEGVDPSEASLDVLDAQIANQEPLTELELRYSIGITPDRTPDINQIRCRLYL